MASWRSVAKRRHFAAQHIKVAAQFNPFGQQHQTAQGDNGVPVNGRGQLAGANGTKKLKPQAIISSKCRKRSRASDWTKGRFILLAAHI
jgi:hypothetical protein